MAKRKNNDLQNFTHKIKGRVTLTPIKTGVNVLRNGNSLFITPLAMQLSLIVNI